MIHIPQRTEAADRDGPLVTYIISTYNRPVFLKTAIASALGQDYRNLQVIVVRDGGEECRETIDSFDDDRLEFIDRAENHGKCYSYNEAFQYARGKYVAYLDDDDLHYRHHVRSQIDVLEGDTDCQASYSDLYGVGVHVRPDKSRVVLAKMHMVSRDYSPWFMMQFNCAPGGSTIHRTDLYDRVGPYNENLRVMIDWDYARRISFYTDLHHLPQLTGEFFVQVNKTASDRISDRGRRDMEEYNEQCRHLSWARPDKPWHRWKDTSIIYLMDEPNPESLSCLGQMLSHTLFPFLVYVPLSSKQLAKIDVEYDPVRFIEVPDGATSGRRVDACLDVCEGDFAAVVADRYPCPSQWIESNIWALMHDPAPNVCYPLPSRNQRRATLLRADELRQARKQQPHDSVWRSIQAARIEEKRINEVAGPFYFDGMMSRADRLINEGRHRQAGDVYRKIKATGNHHLITRSRAAWCYMMDGESDEQGIEMLEQVRQELDTTDFMILQAQMLKRQGRCEQAAALLEKALTVIKPYEVASA